MQNLDVPVGCFATGALHHLPKHQGHHSFARPLTSSLQRRRWSCCCGVPSLFSPGKLRKRKLEQHIATLSIWHCQYNVSLCKPFKRFSNRSHSCLFYSFFGSAISCLRLALSFSSIASCRRSSQYHKELPAPARRIGWRPRHLPLASVGQCGWEHHETPRNFEYWYNVSILIQWSILTPVGAQTYANIYLDWSEGKVLGPPCRVRTIGSSKVYLSESSIFRCGLGAQHTMAYILDLRYVQNVAMVLAQKDRYLARHTLILTHTSQHWWQMCPKMITKV